MMKSEMKKRFPLLIAQAAVGIALLAGAVVASAQAPKPFRGTITAISGNTLTVKTDADGVQQVNVPATATLKRVAPGQTDLKSAETIPFSDLAAGDRVLVTPDPNATEATAQALRIIAIKQTDLAQKREKDLSAAILRAMERGLSFLTEREKVNPRRIFFSSVVSRSGSIFFEAAKAANSVRSRR